PATLFGVIGAVVDRRARRLLRSDRPVASGPSTHRVNRCPTPNPRALKPRHRLPPLSSSSPRPAILLVDPVQDGIPPIAAVPTHGHTREPARSGLPANPGDRDVQELGNLAGIQ